MNIQDITERYREDPADIRLLHERKIDAIIHVTPANEKPDQKLFELIKNAVNKSKDPCIKSECLQGPHLPKGPGVVSRALNEKCFRNSNLDMCDQSTWRNGDASLSAWSIRPR